VEGRVTGQAIIGIARKRRRHRRHRTMNNAQRKRTPVSLQCVSCQSDDRQAIRAVSHTRRKKNAERGFLDRENTKKFARLLCSILWGRSLSQTESTRTPPNHHHLESSWMSLRINFTSPTMQHNRLLLRERERERETQIELGSTPTSSE
jgi:hypothetical protein